MSGPVGAKATQDKSSSQADRSPERPSQGSRSQGAHADVLALQRTIGNSAVGRLLQPVANGLTTPEVHVPPIVNEVLRNGSGKPMNGPTRNFMESRFGRDLSQVRLHTDGLSAGSARSIGAKAYTVGSHVVFGDNAYSPDSESGQRLLAHELTHVVQQSNSSPSGTASRFSERGDPSEVEAEHVAERVVSGSHTSELAIGTAPSGYVQGQWEYAKDAWKHIKQGWAHLTKKSGEAEKEKEEGDWAEGSEEVALHSKEVLEGAKLVAEHLSKSMKEDPEAAEKAAHLAENFEEASKLVETGEQGFNALKKGVEISGELSELKDAVDKLNEISDLRANPEQSARAFDDFFGATGKLAHRLPDGPWKGYTELLTHFKDHGGFFLNMTHALGKNARDADRVAEDKPTLDPEMEVQRSIPAPKSLEEVGRDVEAKFNRALSLNVVARGGQEDYEEFKSAYEILVSLQKNAQGNWLQRTFPKFHKIEPATAEEIKTAAKRTFDALRSLDIALTMNANSPPDVSLAPDLVLIQRYTGD